MILSHNYCLQMCEGFTCQRKFRITVTPDEFELSWNYRGIQVILTKKFPEV